MHRLRTLALALGLFFGASPSALAQEAGGAVLVAEDGNLGLVPIFRGGYLHQVATDIDDGGRFSVSRAAFQAGAAYVKSEDDLIALVLAYRYDGYAFSGDGIFGRQPWSDVHSLSLALLVQWELAPRWKVVAVPLASISGESGAAFRDSLTGGAIGGFTYTFGKTLTIGPGFGVLTQIERAPSVFPFLLVDWKITPQLTFSTGTGVGATQGPGLVLKYRPKEAWELLLGARYDLLRFRLDARGKVANGIGEDASMGIVGGVTYRFGPRRLGYVGLLVGLDFWGTFRLEDARGSLIASQSRDPAVTVGFNFGLGF